MKKFLKLRNFSLIIIVISISFISAPAHACWWLWVQGIPVTESTQLSRLTADIKEVTEQLTMLKEHLAMLNSLKSCLLQFGNGQIMEIFTEA